MGDFLDQDLRGARFERVELEGATFRDVSLRNAAMIGVEVDGLTITGDIGRLTVNGVEVGAFVESELDRRHPDRVNMRPGDPAGFRTAWDILERLWAGTVERARTFDPAQLHQRVNGEWSFIETQRHLVFATECWVRRAILGDPAPWDPLSLPWDGMPDTPGVPRDRAARPSLDTVLALRRDRAASVREILDGLTDESLAGHTVPVHGPGWPEPRSYPVRECLQVVLIEEWEHRLYAERDLDAL